jgi:energy-coupling factor transport system permease protein
MPASFMNNSLADSFPARLDVRTKLLISVLCSLSAIVLTGTEPLLLLVAVSTAYAFSTRNIKGTLIAYTFVMLMMSTSILFAMGIGMFFPEFGNIKASRFLTPFLRMLLMINVMVALALTSRIQSILTSLKSLRLPGFLFIPATVMIRFIPTFIEDVKQIGQTMKMRGYPMTPLTLVRHPLRSVRLIFAPVVFRALRSADELAIAAELKGVSASNKITRYEEIRFAGRDYLTVAFTILLLSTAFWMQYKLGFSFGRH